ncbi:MAG: hypothetical protein IJ877_04905 [Candidatus Gastranaerophilales bacterium]|nr:hypothetical protein [Candidatus Gastranaerophilales bacterium]
MDNMLSKVKQPAPAISGAVTETTDSQGKKYKIIQGPNVGVVDVPKISKTPITDWIELKREEIPHTVYKLSEKKYSLRGMHTTVGLGVIACGIYSLLKIFKK